MSAWDGAISLYLNSFVHRSGTFDGVMLLLAQNQLLKSAPLLVAYWYAWFHSGPRVRERREAILVSLLASLAALAVARLLVIALPARLRPIEDPLLHLVRPYGTELLNLSDWSSFPSDHAVFFVALAVGLFALSRRAGWAALSYVAFMVLLPRLYLGLHYASDLLAGAIIGGLLTWAALRLRPRFPAVRRWVLWSERNPAAFHVAAFVVTWQMAVLFDDLRGLASFSFHLIDHLALLAP